MPLLGANYLVVSFVYVIQSKPMRIILVIVCLALISQACKKKIEYVHYSNYKPILMPQEQLVNSVSFQAAKDIKKVGQVLSNANYLFILEPYKGIHYFDNSNPAAPIALGFIEIPGCSAMAVKDNLILVDNGPDLLTIDYANKTIKGRLSSALGNLSSPDLSKSYTVYDSSGWPRGSVIVGWQKVKTN